MAFFGADQVRGSGQGHDYIDAHCSGDAAEISSPNLEKAAAERVAPTFFVDDKIEIGQQGANRCFLAGQEGDVAAEWLEGWVHFDLVGGVVTDGADGGEALQRVAVAELGARRIEDKPITTLHTAQIVRAAVVGLGEAAGDAETDMVT